MFTTAGVATDSRLKRVFLNTRVQYQLDIS